MGTAILIRAIHATGNAFVITATFTYCAIEYDQAVGQVFVSRQFSPIFRHFSVQHQTENTYHQYHHGL